MREKPAGIGYRVGYVSYLLRLWRVRVGGQETWRASLESAHTGQRLAFAGLPELFSYLQERTGQAAEGHPDEHCLPEGGTFRSSLSRVRWYRAIVSSSGSTPNSSARIRHRLSYGPRSPPPRLTRRQCKGLMHYT